MLKIGLPRAKTQALGRQGWEDLPRWEASQSPAAVRAACVIGGEEQEERCELWHVIFNEDDTGTRSKASKIEAATQQM